MKFKSRKGILFTGLVYSISLALIGIICFRFLDSDNEPELFLWTDILLMLVPGFLLWLYYGTSYHLTTKVLKYKSGPMSGQIEIERIQEIVKGKTLWIGLKPATARNGLIIKYDKYSEIYISPKTNDLFIQHLLKLNKGITKG